MDFLFLFLFLVSLATPVSNAVKKLILACRAGVLCVAPPRGGASFPEEGKLKNIFYMDREGAQSLRIAAGWGSK